MVDLHQLLLNYTKSHFLNEGFKEFVGVSGWSNYIDKKHPDVKMIKTIYYDRNYNYNKLEILIGEVIVSNFEGFPKEEQVIEMVKNKTRQCDIVDKIYNPTQYAEILDEKTKIKVIFTITLPNGLFILDQHLCFDDFFIKKKRTKQITINQI